MLNNNKKCIWCRHIFCTKRRASRALSVITHLYTLVIISFDSLVMDPSEPKHDADELM